MHFRDRNGGSPLRAIAKQGQRYSFQERVGDDTRAWTHKRTDTVRATDFVAVLLEAANLLDPTGGTHES